MRELFVLFEERSGLKPGQEYQIVMHGSVHGDAHSGGRYLDVFTMDDVNISPYVAIERGEATLMDSPARRANAAGAPRWLVPGGFRLIGDAVESMIRLEQGEAMKFEIIGDDIYNIQGGSIVRVMLWPLTIWRLLSTCSAKCTAKCAVCGHVCGEVKEFTFHRNTVDYREGS